MRDHDDLKKRLSELDDDIDQARGRRTNEESNRQRSSAIGYAFRLAIELVVGVCFGGFVGWLLDKWFETTPIFLLVFFILGLAAGIMNVIRTAHQMQTEFSDDPGSSETRDKSAKRDQDEDED